MRIAPIAMVFPLIAVAAAQEGAVGEDHASRARGDQHVFADLQVEPRSLYVTESYTATLTLGIRKVEIGGRIVEMDLLGDVLDVRGSQLSVFAGGRADSIEQRLVDSDGRRHPFEIFRVTRTIRAEEVGNVRIGPIMLRADYPTAVRRRFGRRRITRMREETARAEAILVEIKAPPEQGRPADFTGAIGCYRMEGTAKPSRVEQGKPVTLTIMISGDPIEGIAGPDLRVQSELAGRFDYAIGELIGDIRGDTKTFRHAIIPRHVGKQTIPPILWSYFDPRAERYVTRTSDPIIITVDLPSGDSMPIELTDEATSGNGVTLAVVSGDISPNYIEAGSVLASQAFTLTTGWTASLIVPPLAWLILTLTTRHRARLRADVGLARRRRAKRNARALLNRATRDPRTRQQWSTFEHALKSYLSDRFDLSVGELTSDQAAAVLIEHGGDETMAGEVAELIDACNAARFAPGASAPMSVERAADRVRAWINRIERMTR